MKVSSEEKPIPEWVKAYESGFLAGREFERRMMSSELERLTREFHEQCDNLKNEWSRSL